MYSVTKIYIKQDNTQLFDYCTRITKAANCLRNAALFRIRQMFTMFGKPENEVTANERNVYNEIANALPNMRHVHKMPSKGRSYLNGTFLEDLFYATHNSAFFCDDLPRQSAQHILTTVNEEMKSFFALIKAFKKDPNKFTARPKLPHYGKKGGMHTVEITNQVAVISTDNSGSHYLKLPKTKTRLNLGDAPVNGKLKQVNIVPVHGVFLIILTFEYSLSEKPLCAVPKRIATIDLGVNNFASITNNIGKPCLLFKGGAIKSANQFYNKRMAQITSKQTKGTINKFVPTPASQNLCIWRENVISDFMHKLGKYIINWADDNGIDTIVIGENKGWKQNLNIGKTNNQNFAYIPFDKFKSIMTYLGVVYGIRIILVDESYTSKASFLDNDPIPTYGEEGADKVKFSGKRAPTRYNSKFGDMYKKYGFRGLYTASDGTVINSDLNGSANIGRKAIPDMYDFGEKPDFSNVIVIKHPDYDGRATNSREKQKSGTKDTSKSKLRRLNKKQKKKALKKENVTQK